jgi:hypothetical protein
MSAPHSLALCRVPMCLLCHVYVRTKRNLCEYRRRKSGLQLLEERARQGGAKRRPPGDLQRIEVGCTPAANAFDDSPHTMPFMQPEQQNSICIR